MALSYSTEISREWKLHELDNIIDSFENEVYNYVATHEISAKYDYTNALLELCGKVMVVFREIITLVSFGYPDGALSLARNLYEQMIFLCFFENRRSEEGFQNIVADYYLDGMIKAAMEEKYFYEYCSEDTVLLQQAKERIKELKQKAHRKPVKRDYWWADADSFVALAEKVRKEQPSDASEFVLFLQKLHLTYKQACLMLHASSVGNAVRLGEKIENCISTAPVKRGHGTPLWFATASFICVVGVICSNFGMDYSKYKESLNNLAMEFNQRALIEKEEAFEI